MPHCYTTRVAPQVISVGRLLEPHSWSRGLPSMGMRAAGCGKIIGRSALASVWPAESAGRRGISLYGGRELAAGSPELRSCRKSLR
jgi:hypothetical protein